MLKVAFFGCTKVLYDKYVVIFGGRNDDGKQDDVWIYCVGDGKFKRSNVKCPRKSAYRPFTINDRKRDETITFVRDKWRKCGINNHLFPLRCLIKIMHGIISMNTFIYLEEIQGNIG